MTDRRTSIATSSQTVGPFFHFGLATDTALGCLTSAATKGERIRLSVRVIDGAGQPVPDALVEIYQADADGAYAGEATLGAGPEAAADDARFSGFGRLATGADGRCTFETVKPGAIRRSGAIAEAAHINVCLLARGLLRQIYTRIYFDGDAGLAGDPLLGVVPPDRRATLFARQGAEPGTWEFDLRLQGENETVFFDL